MHLQETGGICGPAEENQPGAPEYLKLHPLEDKVLEEYKDEMEKLDELSLVFDELPMYQTPETIKERMVMVLNYSQMKKIQEY